MKNKLTCSLLLFFPLLVNTCKETKLAPCLDVAQIKKQWRNEYILAQEYNAKNVIIGSNRMYPSGTFKLNDSTYNVMSDEVPLNGTWEVSKDCKLILDKGTDSQRAFVVETLTADSLIISRKDSSTLSIYIQHYSRN